MCVAEAAPPGPGIRPTSRTVLPGAATVAVTFGLARYGYGLLLPEMQNELGLSAGAAGFVSSGSYLSYLLANTGVVWVTERFGPRAAIGAAAALAAVGMAIIAGAGSVPVLAAGVLVAGAAAGFAFPPYADLVARGVRERRRDVAWSAISSGTGWGVAIAGPIAIAAGDHWRIAWVVFVALAVLIGIGAVRAAPARGSERPRRPQLSWTWFFCPKSRPLLISAVLVGTGSAVWWAFSVDALREAGVDATSARIVYAVCGAAGILASASGVVLARLGLRTGYLAMSVLLAGSLALLAVAASHVLAAVTAAVLFGVFYNGVIAAHVIWSARVFADHPAAGLAAFITALTIGTLAGPGVAGVAIAQFGFTPALLGAAAAVLAALVFCPPSARRREALNAHQCRAARVRP
jgi:predicted MFS family arabinose efflux permease